MRVYSNILCIGIIIGVDQIKAQGPPPPFPYSHYGNYPYYPHWPGVAAPSLSRNQRKWVVDREQRNELPILNPKRLDPNLLMVCDDALSPDDIYTGLVAVLVRVEDTLRRNRCSRARFGIHQFPIDVHTLLGKLSPAVTPRLQKHPILGTYLDTMQARAHQLIKKASHCKLDYVLLMKIVRMSMKLLVNKVMCGFVEVDVLGNRYGWPSRHGTRLRHHKSPLPITHYSPYYDGTYPYTRNPWMHPSFSPYLPYANTLKAKAIPAVEKDGEIQPVQKWPYYPPDYAPSNPYLGALGPNGRQLNGVDSGCKECDKNRDVIIP